MPAYKAVIFDIGGVCVASPFRGIAKYEREHGLPPNYINVAMYVGYLIQKLHENCVSIEIDPFM